MNRLQDVGKGALTGASMLAAVRQGRDPFAMFAEREAQAQALQNAQQEGLLKIATALQDPATRAYLMQNPQAAATLGLPTETVSGASASFPMDPEAGATLPVGTAQPGGGGLTIQPQGHQQFSRTRGVLPPDVETSESLRRQELKGSIEGQRFAQGVLSGQQGVGGAEGMTLQGYTVDPTSGRLAAQFAPKPTQVFQEGVEGPLGKLRPGQTVGGKEVLIEPNKAAVANKSRLSLIDSALNTFNTIYNTRLDPQTGKESPTGVLPHTVLPGATGYLGTAGLLAEGAPGALSFINRVRGQYGSEFTKAAVQRLKSGSGSVVSFVKAMGDAGNAAQQEQERAINAFLPTPGDTAPVADMKRQLTPKILMAVREKLSALEPQLAQLGEKDAAALAWSVVAQAASEAESQATGVGTTRMLTPPGAQPPPAGQPAPTAAPSTAAPTGAPAGLDEINAKRKALGMDPIVPRAKGGSVKKGQTALVGEGGNPELVMRPQFIQGPAQVQPLQLAQSMPWAPRQLQAPMEQAPQQLIPPPRPDDSGLSRGGVGLRPEDVQAAQQGGQVIWDPVLGQAVVVPR